VSRACKPDPELVNVQVRDLERELATLTSLASTRASVRRAHLETLICMARLAKAIHDSELWYARRERQLERLDRRAYTAVSHLVADGRVRPALAWHRG
jgi:hypothetical protein